MTLTPETVSVPKSEYESLINANQKMFNWIKNAKKVFESMRGGVEKAKELVN